jgi:hypothetical protein
MSQGPRLGDLVDRVELLEDRFNGVRVAPGDVIEPGRDKILADRFALPVGIAPLVAELDHQPRVLDLEHPLLLIGDELWLRSPLALDIGRLGHGSALRSAVTTTLSQPRPPCWFIGTIIRTAQTSTNPSVATATLQGGDQARRLLLGQIAVDASSPDRPGHSIEVQQPGQTDGADRTSEIFADHRNLAGSPAARSAIAEPLVDVCRSALR